MLDCLRHPSPLLLHTFACHSVAYLGIKCVYLTIPDVWCFNNTVGPCPGVHCPYCARGDTPSAGVALPLLSLLSLLCQLSSSSSSPCLMAKKQKEFTAEESSFAHTPLNRALGELLGSTDVCLRVRVVMRG
jgi:hypothetical protein|mmetsp:Transcript_25344/g.56127  ORF Transcript_25344/g.56127 Transcript_25344/m.56127 type:complete len:131 (+) Transcript_25344:882-1274(+)